MIRPVRKVVRGTGGWLKRVAGRRLESRGLILLYHRVAESPADPWNLCVSPANFRVQLEALGRYLDVVPLDELPAALRRARRGRALAAITFDDGYVDNLAAAVPTLQATGMPATVFLATRWAGLDAPFWWDRLAWVVLAPPRLPDRLELPLPDGAVQWTGRTGSGPHWPQWRGRLALHDRLWEALRRLDHGERDEALAALAEWSGADPTPAEAGRAMTAAEARLLAGSGVVQVGAHTVNHPMLPELPAERQLEEIRGSVEACGAITGVRPGSFAYPHGKADATTIRLAGEAGLEIACTGEERLVRVDDPPLALPRVSVHDWGRTRFEQWLRWYWLP
jgi:peptidoglycan/xylan/chitin deacetylase (PgdA/CDA1 family)